MEAHLEFVSIEWFATLDNPEETLGECRMVVNYRPHFFATWWDFLCTKFSLGPPVQYTFIRRTTGDEHEDWKWDCVSDTGVFPPATWTWQLDQMWTREWFKTIPLWVPDEEEPLTTVETTG